MTHATTESSRPTWWAYAQKAVRRLQQDEAENPLSRGTMKLGGARRGFGLDDDLPAQLEASADVPPASPLSILSAVPDLRHLPPEDWDEIADAGGDPAATTERGDALPPVQVPWRKLLITNQLAASVGSAERLDDILAAGAVTLLTGVAEDDLKLTAQMLTHLIPEDWLIHFEGGDDFSEQCLSVIKPRVTDGKIGATAARDYLADVVRGMQSSMPVLIVQTSNATLPPDLPVERLQRIALMPVTRDVLVATLCTSHSATGRIDEARVRAALPEDSVLSSISPIRLAFAMRGVTGREVAERLSGSVAMPKKSAGAEPGLDDFTGAGKALRAARQLVRDLALWRAGTIGWHDLSRSLLVYGPPGTGKTWLARAIGNDANLSVVTGSFAQWQAEGHLGDMLRAMRRSFAEARRETPAVLIIDEIDAAGSRQDSDRHNHNYRVQVINSFLAELDSLSREEGVIVVGTCNHPETLDPAILRAGRFDLKLEMPLPDAETLYGVFRRHLTFAETDLRDLSRRAVGHTPADIDAIIRQVRAECRSDGRELTLEYLRACFGGQEDGGLLRRIAIHECGHAIVCAALGLGRVTRVLLTRGGGEIHVDLRRQAGLTSDITATLSRMLAGRAAERLIFGTVSAGAGGSIESDIAQATQLALAIDSKLGLGLQGAVWRGGDEAALLQDPAILDAVRGRIEDAEDRALAILATHRALLEDMAKALVAAREFGPAEAVHWLRQLPGSSDTVLAGALREQPHLN